MYTIGKKLLFDARLLRHQRGLYVGYDAALRYCDVSEHFVELLVVANGKKQMTRIDARLFVVARCVAGELEHLGGKILENGGYIDGRAGADSFGIMA